MRDFFSSAPDENDNPKTTNNTVRHSKGVGLVATTTTTTTTKQNKTEKKNQGTAAAATAVAATTTAAAGKTRFGGVANRAEQGIGDTDA